MSYLSLPNLATISVCCLLALSACSGSGNSDATASATATTSTGAGGSGGAGGTGMAPAASTGSLTVTVGAGGSCPSTCSTDLKQVIDCNGQLAETCGLDEACLSGACSDKPCDAAAAAGSSIGCDYWALKPDVISTSGTEGACFAAYIANTWDTPVQITASRGSQNLSNFVWIPKGQGSNVSYEAYDDMAGLGVGEVAILFLAHDLNVPGNLPKCPQSAGFIGNPGLLGTGIGEAFNIKASRPVVAYTIYPYGGGQAAATSATLLLPTPAWGTNYIAVNAYEKSTAVPNAQPSLTILAKEDDTNVKLLPKVNLVGGNGVPATLANNTMIVTLNKGQYVQISQDEELTGSPIEADKPVAHWGAASCLNIPVNASACDSAHQQIPPVKALGFEYVGVRYRNRSTAMGEETPPWRLVGAVDGTTLTWSPTTPQGAPTTLASGELAEFEAAGPFSVASQDADHPFYMAQYMTGAGHLSGSEGDPEWVNVVPPQQYLKRYVFFTDPTYPETSLVVIRRRDPNTKQFADVTLDCAGTLDGWQTVGDSEYTRIDLVTGNFMDVGNCSNGRQEMTSDANFGVTVWGWGTGAASPSSTHVSYAYPAGAGIRPINEITVPTTPK